MILQSFLCTINWGMVGWVLVGAIVFIVVVAAVGRAIAAAFPPNPEHVSNFRKPSSPVVPTSPAAPTPAPVAPVALGAAASTPASPTEISPEIMAVIAASVAVVLRGQQYTITGVSSVATPPADIERLMSLWSLEGRRQVYSSHSLSR